MIALMHEAVKLTRESYLEADREYRLASETAFETEYPRTALMDSRSGQPSWHKRVLFTTKLCANGSSP